MKLHAFQKTKDNDYVKPYLVEGKTVYSYDKHGKMVIKKVTDFYMKPQNEVPIISVEKNDDVIIPEEEVKDNSFYEETPIEEPTEIVAEEPAETKTEEPAVSTNTDEYDDDLMNFSISTDVPEEEPEDEVKTGSKVIITENDPYGDYF